VSLLIDLLLALLYKSQYSPPGYFSLPGGTMLVLRPFIFIFAAVSFVASVSAQQSAGPQTIQAASIIQQGITAMTGGAPVTDVTMTGTTTVMVTPINQGSATGPTQSPDTATVTLEATAVGQGKTSATSSAGTRTEIRDISGASPTLIEVGSDGVSHTVTTQTTLSPYPGWFYPLFLLKSGLTSSSFASSYIGEDVWNGVPVQHIAIWSLPSAGSTASSMFLQQATRHDLYLDASSLLPIGMTFTVPPYDPKNPNKSLVASRGNSVDSIEQITFSDYRQVQGRSVAFHLHSSMTAGLLTITSDTQFSSVVFNSGLTISAN
jgi:hypothetical protein